MEEPNVLCFSMERNGKSLFISCHSYCVQPHNEGKNAQNTKITKLWLLNFFLEEIAPRQHKSEKVDFIHHLIYHFCTVYEYFFYGFMDAK